VVAVAFWIAKFSKKNKMALGEEERPTPEVQERPALTIEALVTALREVQWASQAPPGDRYCLKPPIFGGDSDVEQFIREFEDVATIAEWPAPVRIL